MRKLGISGDTIIEVLVAITVVSAVLGGAYASASRSLRQTRMAQERGESLKLAEAQLERLKSVALNPASTVFSTASYFCLDSSLQVRNLTTMDRDDFSSATYPAECQQAPMGGTVYYVSIDRSPGNVFTVLSRWDRATGTGRDEVKIVYRLYQ